MATKNKAMYAVRQHQAESEYDGELIYIYDNRNDAVEAARNLNITYGNNCVFSPEGDFMEAMDEDESSHWYEVEQMDIDKNIPVIEQYGKYAISVWEIGMFNHWRGYVARADMMTEIIDQAMIFDDWNEVMRTIRMFNNLDMYGDKRLVVEKVHI